ncbi:L-serine ammonia-lyase [uncultured Agrococcus sp.]|uniref:L-serine ammonia-lyase n=1 Tax=uncultured Agrococcus sp. TaxID=382258 RepID=UPI0025F79A5F|nr:L-serine ammonia-lyase [uncultured Agrococcus sp.]
MTTQESLGAHATSPAPVFEHLSVLDLFKVGIGPSSSHTVGPMRAAADFAEALRASGRLRQAQRVQIDLFGSLAATGSGHATDSAVMLGLSGLEPDTVVTAEIGKTIDTIHRTESITLAGEHTIPFNAGRDTIFRPLTMRPEHPNAMRLTVTDESGDVISTAGYYSIGGGFVMRHDDDDVLTPVPAPTENVQDVPYPFTTADGLLEHCRSTGLSIPDLMLENETAWRERDETIARLVHIWQVMQECVDAGIATGGVLPGGLKVRRRAKQWHERLIERENAAETSAERDRLDGMEWVNLFALAVNEENAAGNRVVTAPTNGAAGIIPAVMHYFDRFGSGESDSASMPWSVRFLLAAGAIGIVIKSNASISGAEVGCQGEVGSACAMAAAGFAAVIDADTEQIENAAEIGLEHNLGLTCDPVGGLVQIPCIERNAMAAVKAINAARMAKHGDGSHHISLDTAVETMRATGADMSHKYKETAMGGLAVAYVEC